jgi:hypothetical protein
MAFGVVGEPLGLAGRIKSDIEKIFRDVDTDVLRC